MTVQFQPTKVTVIISYYYYHSNINLKKNRNKNPHLKHLNRNHIDQLFYFKNQDSG